MTGFAPRHTASLLLGNCSCVTLLPYVLYICIALLPSIHGHMQNLHFHHPCRSYSMAHLEYRISFLHVLLINSSIFRIEHLYPRKNNMDKPYCFECSSFLWCTRYKYITHHHKCSALLKDLYQAEPQHFPG